MEHGKAQRSLRRSKAAANSRRLAQRLRHRGSVGARSPYPRHTTFPAPAIRADRRYLPRNTKSCAIDRMNHNISVTMTVEFEIVGWRCTGTFRTVRFRVGRINSCMKFIRCLPLAAIAIGVSASALAQDLPQAGIYLDRFGGQQGATGTFQMMPRATSTPITGTSTTAAIVGPFTPQLGRPITVALAGTWSGTAQLLRSTDGGTTKLPLTPAGVTLGTYSAQGVDQPWIETDSTATFYLSLPAANITYKVSN